MRLKRLQPHLPPKLASLLPLLDSAGFKSSDQIIYTPFPEVVELISAAVKRDASEATDESHEQRRKLINKKEFDQIKSTCISLEAGPCFVPASTSYAESRLQSETANSLTNPNAFPFAYKGFHCPPLDALLPPSTFADAGSGIIEFVGAGRSGKSLLLMHLVLRYLWDGEEYGNGGNEKMDVEKDSAGPRENAEAIQDLSGMKMAMTKGEKDVKGKGRCIWIDTTGSFEAERALAVLEGMGCKSPEEVLDRISLLRAFDFSELSSAITQDLPERLQEERRIWQMAGERMEVDVDMDGRAVGAGEGEVEKAEGERGNREEEEDLEWTGMVVIDCLTNVLSPVLSGNTIQGQAQVEEFMQSLSTLTRRYGLICAFTNLPTSSSSSTLSPSSAFSTTTIRPSLGTSFGYWSDVSVGVMDVRGVFRYADGNGGTSGRGGNEGKKDQGRRVVEVWGSRIGPSGIWGLIDIDGIKLYDPLVD